MLDKLRGLGLVPPMVVADGGSGEIGCARTGSTGRAISDVVRVKSSTSLHDTQAWCEVPASTSERRGSRSSITSYQSALAQANAYRQTLPDAFEQVRGRSARFLLFRAWQGRVSDALLRCSLRSSPFCATGRTWV